MQGQARRHPELHAGKQSKVQLIPLFQPEGSPFHVREAALNVGSKTSGGPLCSRPNFATQIKLNPIDFCFCLSMV